MNVLHELRRGWALGIETSGHWNVWMEGALNFAVLLCMLDVGEAYESGDPDG